MLIIICLPGKTQNYMSLASLCQQNAIRNYQQFLAKDLEDQYIKMNIKQKLRIKIQQMNIDVFSNQTLQELTGRCFMYSIVSKDARRYDALKYYLSKCITKKYNVIVNRKDFFL